jgi:succinoglycan biosynthesis protein ExoO
MDACSADRWMKERVHVRQHGRYSPSDLEEPGDNLSRMRLLRRTTAARGPSRARNLAIRPATSRWIAFLDANDQWHAEFIEELQKLMDRASETVGCLFTGWQDVWPDGAITQDSYSAKFRAAAFNWLDMEAFVSSWLELRSCPMWTSAIAVRRDILLKAGLFPERCRRGEDKDTWLRVMTLTDAISSPRVCSTYYRGMPGELNDAFSTNMRHCLCITLQGLIARTSGTRRRLLMQLFNHQVFEHSTSYERACFGPAECSEDPDRGPFDWGGKFPRVLNSIRQR